MDRVKITSLITGFLVVLTCLAKSTQAQSTNGLGKGGCSFLDDQNVYNVELMKGRHQAPCPSLNSLNDDFKQTEDKISETAYELSRIQTRIVDLLDLNNQLTTQVHNVQDELRATLYALKSGEVVLADCPAGYTIKNDQFRSCYMLTSRKLTWFEAELFCQSTRGHLVALETEEEAEYVVQQIRSSREMPGAHVWTGGNDLGKEGAWMWAGHNEPFSYTNWRQVVDPDKGIVQQPDNDDEKEHCMHLFHLDNYKWNDANCQQDNYYYFICEYKIL